MLRVERRIDDPDPNVLRARLERSAPLDELAAKACIGRTWVRRGRNDLASVETRKRAGPLALTERTHENRIRVIGHDRQERQDFVKFALHLVTGDTGSAEPANRPTCPLE